ncbi:Extradiol ring-cleavage dioxygenase, class III enzyme, subunit B [Yarrowia lipolytica]|jgi:4,5-DOPA dioxygenase extradiol|nr:hypothetical protein YALI1_C09009g [Yarrowia lipolytica]KAB8281210.1 Extradiol ring-cleavage dioxygenase, class III enzyme, subunit B [Yarrowia lipolytica]KAE8170366.1 Extradiol ring-cleavage dioxygenase, class III enzyme, subunit B [Yarrowia lipolytica]QNP96463.1 Hypothetical protein YALI2_C00116g [Yarrowia lipolytica]RDW24595.1 Extradiol ring-cleavage dioxygenase, class III enzyme, subunit B [Yarrowia lipolytica]
MNTLTSLFFLTLAVFASLLGRKAYISNITNTPITSTTTNTQSYDTKLPDLDMPSIAKRTPVLFVPHGGPTLMYEGDPNSDQKAFAYLRAFGRELLKKHKENPESVKGVIVMSAHWEHAYQKDENPREVSPNKLPKITPKLGKIPVGIATDPADGLGRLEYDFFGFPRKLYQEKFFARHSHELALKVADVIDSSDKYQAQLRTDKKWDHGLWVSSKVMFEHAGEADGEVPFPVLQISEPAGDQLKANGNEDDVANRFYDLGKVLAPLREQGYWIIGSGMSVHNLRELGAYYGGHADYAVTFEKEVNKLVQNVTANEDGKIPDEQYKRNVKTLWNDKDRRRAHPTAEHLFPLFFALGAADGDKGKQVYAAPQASLSWGTYKWQ